MSDAAFDAARASGEYPPKGWGWQDEPEQRRWLQRIFDNPDCPIMPWVKREAARLRMPVPSGREEY